MMFGEESQPVRGPRTGWLSLVVARHPGLPFSILALILLPAASLPQQDPSFLLTTDDPAYEIPGYLGNGVFSIATKPRGIEAAESFMIGVYDNAEGDIPRIALLPVWNEVNLWNGRRWLDASPLETLRSYLQTLDMYNGVLRTRYDWAEGERVMSVLVEAFVSRADPHLGVVRMRIRPRYRGRVKVELPLTRRDEPPRLPLAEVEELEPGWGHAELWYPGHMLVNDRRVERAAGRPFAMLVSETEGRGTTLVQAMVVDWSENVRPDIRPIQADDRIGAELTFDVESGREYTVHKFVGLASSWSVDDPRETAGGAARRALDRGYESIYREHAAAWHRLWETDIVLEGAPELQRVLRAMLFYLLSSVRPETGFGIPPMGLSTAGYYGHIFWDADTYMFPPLLVTHPDIARSIVMFRSRTLEAAKARARQHGYEGAMYPWEADERGEETTPKFAEQNALMENHIVGDVALAQWQYFLTTGDTAYLRQYGYPVIEATADFWVSRVTYEEERDRYETRGVVSVHEGLIGISNDTYTNAIAKKNLEIAIEASRLLGREPRSDWIRVAEKMLIPFDKERQLHPTYEGAPDETLGDVVNLLSYPLEIPMSEEVRRNNLRHAARKLLDRGGGAMMGSSFYPVVAAELRDRELFEELIPHTFQPYLRGPFLALAEAPGNDAINFVTGAGAFLQQVIFGYTGLRIGANGLERRHAPMLPPGVDRLVLKNIPMRDGRYDVVVENGHLELTPVRSNEARQVPPVLEFPEPELDDTAAYRGYTTRFFKDQERNAYQVYLKRREGRVVAVWANGANESVGFTVRDTAGEPVFLEWGSPGAELGASGDRRSVAYILQSPAGVTDIGLFLLGSMRKERDFQYHELHLEPFDSPPFILDELTDLVRNLERLPEDVRAAHLEALDAEDLDELHGRLHPDLLPFQRDTLIGVRLEHVTLDGANRLALEIAVDRRRAMIDARQNRIRVRPRDGSPVSVWIRTTTDAPALRSMDREQIFNEEFLAAYRRAMAECDSLSMLSSRARGPGTAAHERILGCRRLERRVRGFELLSYEDKLMAGLPNFATYFGRDMLMTALLMEPIWRPEMLEHVVASVLRKLTPEGEVSHEEALGGQAIRENAAEYSRLITAYRDAAAGRARESADSLLDHALEMLKDLQRVRENYLMRDDDFQFPVVAARWLAHRDVAAERKRAFLLGSAGGKPSRLALLLRNLDYVAEASAVYAADPTPTHLVGFPKIDARSWWPGSWRDSRAGYANGRFAMDINAFWVPNALESIGAIAEALRALGFDADDLVAVEPAIRESLLIEYLRDPQALEAAVATWRGARRHFQEALGPAEVDRRVRAKLRWMPELERRYWERVLDRTGAAGDSLWFLALSLDAEGDRILVANTDPAMGLLLEDYTGGILSGTRAPEDVYRLVEVFLRAYPVGVRVAGLGPLAANDAYASQDVWEAFRRDTYHSPRVVWGREVNLFLFGVARQIERAYDEDGRLRDARLDSYVRFLRDALEEVREAVEASGLEHHELWSYEVEDGSLRPVRYGTSTDVQLWNLTDLSVEHVLARLPQP